MSQSPLAPARTAFEKATTLLLSKHSNNAHIQSWLTNKQSLWDVKVEIEAAKAHYATNSGGRIRTWLSKVATSVSKFVPIVDALVPQTSEYASLAWGIVRVLLVLFQNQEELLTQLAKSLDELANVLPQLEIDVDLFNAPDIQRAAESIYGSIVRLFDEMLKFYQESRAKHVLKSLTKPYSVRFQDIVEDVRSKSYLFERLASAYGRREGRVIHVKVDSVNKQQQLSETRILEALTIMHRDMMKYQNVMNDRSLLTHRYLQEIQAVEMINIATSDIFQDPMDLLAFRLSFCRRSIGRKGKSPNLDNIWSSSQLREWSDNRNSHMLLVQGSLRQRTELNAVGTFMADFVRTARIPVFWAFQSAGLAKSVRTTPQQVLKFLAVQALKLNSDNVTSKVSDRMNAVRVASASQDEQWEFILTSALDGLPCTYIVVDLDVLDDQQSAATTLIRSLIRVVETCTAILKVAIISMSQGTHLSSLPSVGQSLNIDQSINSSRGVASRRNDPRARKKGHGKAALAFRSRLSATAR